MTTLANTEFSVEISDSDPIGPDLVRRVTEVCNQVEDSAVGDVLRVRLADTGPDTDAVPDTRGLEVGVVNKWERALRRLERLPVATLAEVHGACRGAAIEALLATDYRIARPTATFRLPAAGTVAWPGMALFRIAAQLGRRARVLALFGFELSAVQALEFGLIDEVAEDPGQAADRWVPQLAGARASDVRIRRDLLAEAASTTFENALGSHLAACDRALRSTSRS